MVDSNPCLLQTEVAQVGYIRPVCVPDVSRVLAHSRTLPTQAPRSVAHIHKADSRPRFYYLQRLASIDQPDNCGWSCFDWLVSQLWPFGRSSGYFCGYPTEDCEHSQSFSLGCLRQWLAYGHRHLLMHSIVCTL